MPKQPHVGEVSAICYVPEIDNMFMSAGLDGRVRLWSSGSQESCMVEPFPHGSTCLSISAHKPSVFAVRLNCLVLEPSQDTMQHGPILQVASEGGQLSVFDLSINTSFALQTLSVGVEDEPVAAVGFSPDAPGKKWLAVTSGDTVIILRVGERLIRSYHDKEHGKQFLQSLADSA